MLLHSTRQNRACQLTYPGTSLPPGCFNTNWGELHQPDVWVRSRTPVEESRYRCTLFAVSPFCWRSLCRPCQPFGTKLEAVLHRAPHRSRPRSGDQTSSSQQSAGETQGQISVQARIRQRREQRRATAIHDAYDHKWESFADMGYLRFTPGPSLQRLTFYAWETGLTRFSNERLGLHARWPRLLSALPTSASTSTARALHPAPDQQYDVLVGPVYRFYLQPKYSISGRVLGGWAYGNFSGDTNGITRTASRPLSRRQHLCRQRQRHRRIQPDPERRLQTGAGVFRHRLWLDRPGQPRLYRPELSTASGKQ